MLLSGFKGQRDVTPEAVPQRGFPIQGVQRGLLGECIKVQRSTILNPSRPSSPPQISSREEFFSQKVMSKQKPHLTRLIGVEVDDDEEVSIMCDQETG